MHDEPTLAMTPFDPFEAGAAERLAAVGKSGGDPFPVRRVAWNDPPRFRPFAAEWRQAGDGWRTWIVPAYMGLFAAISIVMFVFFSIGLAIALELNPARADDWGDILFCVVSGIIFGSLFLLIYFVRFRLDSLTKLRVSANGDVRLSRHRLLLHASANADKPRVAFAVNRSNTRRFFAWRQHTVYMLYLCDDVYPRVLITMSKDPEGVLAAAAELPDDLVRHAEFLLINEPVTAPSYQSWDRRI